MENLKDVLVRVDNLSEGEANSKIYEAKRLLDEGETPENVLVSVHGSEVEHLDSILNPLSYSPVHGT